MANGGRIFSGLLEDGSSFSIRGPWSSGPSEINSLGILSPHILVEASGTTDHSDFNRGYTFYSLSGVSLDIISQAEALLPGWKYHYDSSYSRHPASYGASEEQTRAIEHPNSSLSGWKYVSDFLPCVTCSGRAFVTAAVREKGAWFSDKTNEWRKVCPTCGNGCDSGITPVPGMRWRGEVIRSAQEGVR